jgi:hypothetical protein
MCLDGVGVYVGRVLVTVAWGRKMWKSHDFWTTDRHRNPLEFGLTAVGAPRASRLRNPLSSRYPRSTVRLFVRLRRGGWPTALLMAVLLVVPALDCSLVREHAHSDGHHATAAAAPDSFLDTHDLLNDITTAAHCDVYAVHCTIKAIPPGLVALTFSALLLAAVTAVLSPPPTPPAGGVGVRGPPRRPRSPYGRTILSLHCIARR